MTSTKEYLDFVLEQLSLLDDIENRATLPFLNLRQQGSVFLDYLPKTDVL
ncbi:MAG: hypothetical protein IJJ71_14740 [Treponema sp.]|nr:hypothetical protein [Treponema sp.]MBR0497413.1 hypothetical protein [Treponema sp.]